MAEYNKSKFFWIRLTDSFLTSDTVDFLMDQEGGANYVVLYQMLCLKTVNNNGVLGRQLGEILIEYDAEKIQRDCKYFSIDTVRVALELYKALGLVYRLENGLLRIAEFEKLIGSTSIGAEKKKEQRENKKALESSQKMLSGQKVDICPPDIDIKKEIELKKEKENNILSEFETLWKLYPRKLGKDKAFGYYQKARKSGVAYETIEQGIKAYCDYIIATKTKKEFIKHGSTWFNNSCWNDDYETEEGEKQYGTTEKFSADSKFDALFPNESYI